MTVYFSNNYYRIYWGTGRENRSAILYVDNVDIIRTLTLIGDSTEIRLRGSNQGKLNPFTTLHEAKSLKGFLKRKKAPVNKFTIENKEGITFTGQNGSDLLITIPQNLPSDLVISRYLNRMGRNLIYVFLSCNKNSMLKIDGGRVQEVRPMNAKEFDIFWQNLAQDGKPQL